MSIRHAVPHSVRRPLAALARRWAVARPETGTAAEPEQPEQPEPGTGPDGPAVDGRRIREDELLAGLPGTVRHGDHLAVVREGLMPAACRDGNLADVADVLEAAGIAYGVVPDPLPRHRLAIAPGDRAAVLEAVSAAFGGQAVYADLLEHGRTLATALAEQLVETVAAVEGPEAVEVAEAVEAVEAPGSEPPAEPDPAGPPPDRVKGIRVYRPAVVGDLLYGAQEGCDVEFWDSAAPSPGAIASIDQTSFGWWLPSLAATATTSVSGRDYPLVDAFATVFPDDVDFPVDAVITWVDGDDPDWRRRRDATRGDHPGRSRGLADDTEQRYRSRDELRYCLRSIAAYAPWIRQVFLVTDDQVPAWLDATGPGLTVVSHRELFAGTGAGPVFNSRAIESRLHLVPGLAEHFLYLNDDMFLARPLAPQQFFLGNGLPLCFPDSRVIPPGRSLPDGGDLSDTVYASAQHNTRAVLTEATGRTYPRTLKHVPYPLRRSVLAEAGERFAAELAATVTSPFRSAADLAPVTLGTYYAHATGRAVEGQLVDGYFVTDSTEDLARLPELHGHRWADVLCLADGVRDNVPADEQDRAVTAFLRAYFPAPSPFEHPGAGPA
ncbi:stealth conserved region 3 domain-containing protein [Kitasatospora sp. NPDC088351]|uniref:stealth conserved region 3 domain-containing protein n=1 Tax=Kitasatospora sp. NPDC088351 TaxID=3155180 RepID=UPI00343386D4